MNDRTLEQDLILDERAERRETLRHDYEPGANVHGDEQAGGAIAGGVAGIAVGAVVGGPVGAVVGGAIGAAAGATAGLVRERTRDDEVAVDHEEDLP